MEVAQPTFRGDVQPMTLPGTLEPLSDVKIFAKASGYLHSLEVDIGDRVRKGAVIATLYIPEMLSEMTALEAGVTMKEAQLALDRLTRERLRELREEASGAIREQDLDEAAAKVKMVEADLARSRAEVQHLQTLMDYAKIRAPFGGIVTERYVNEGDFIHSAANSPNAAPIVRLMDDRIMRLFVFVPERHVLQVAVGTRADITLDALQGKQYQGAVSRFASALAPETRVMRTEIQIPNVSRELRSGMYAHVTLHLETTGEVLLVPSTAIKLQEGRPVLFVVRDGVVYQQRVALGADDGKSVEILEGVHATDQVVVSSRENLHDGLRVQIVPAVH
ncbi:MAG: efflux RND transporter periplasmic adaptor subunit [Chloroflexi bacterium]|nr:efflux RND transporter periplasmic adaptor subunit [Chloroflexota bacterium]